MRDGQETGVSTTPLAKVADARAPIVYGIVQPGPECPGGVPFVQSRDVGGAVDVNVLNRTSQQIAEQYRRSKIALGDILFSLRGNIGQSSITPAELDGANIARGVARIRVGAKGDPEFVRYVLQGPVLQRLIARNANGSTFRELSIEELRKLPIPDVSLPEQLKIAEILRTWDEALEKLTVLRAAKERRLGALRAALLFGRLRQKGLRHNWAPTRLEAVTHELTKRNGTKGLGRESVMGVTKAEGVVPMREQTIAADISRYKRLPPRAFAYNPMRINVGSIAMNDRDEAVLVSPDYVVFACNADGLDPDYLDHLRKTSWWAHYINSGGSGSVRQRTYYADLAALKLPLPDLDEQKAIAAVLNTARADLIATEREIEAVTRQKRGLMQKLLTGEWQVEEEDS
ncbi:restriction endonuclease subunit S [Paracoccus albus]|uniref:restriction endonuclease subunit S n=1 Tax=Paracoccus albus TaxID=3017784 RepID=UPI0022EFE01B|nr:restriction endonuclease subunit S [Paracoccus albus]WBU62348.1 restriction endonuclease subunit S [Paracoccus albus]